MLLLRSGQHDHDEQQRGRQRQREHHRTGKLNPVLRHGLRAKHLERHARSDARPVAPIGTDHSIKRSVGEAFASPTLRFGLREGGSLCDESAS
jgi:hypothetical protein